MSIFTLSTGAGYTHARLAETEHGFVTGSALPPYNLANFRAGINSTLGWSATFFVNHLTDKHACLGNVAGLGLPNAAYNQVATDRPRTIGVDLDYRY